jgi:hypothetical protein
LSSLFTVLIESGSMTQIDSMGEFVLYRVDFDRTIFSQLVFSDTFERESANWKPIIGDWSVINGSYCGNFSDFGVAILENKTWSDFVLQADVRGNEDVRETGIIFRYKDAGNYYRLFISGNFTQVRIMKMVNYSATYPDLWVSWTVTDPKTWYTLRVLAIGDSFKVFMDGAFLLSITDLQPLLSGEIGVGGYEEHSSFDNIKVYEVTVKNPLDVEE